MPVNVSFNGFCFLSLVHFHHMESMVYAGNGARWHSHFTWDDSQEGTDRKRVSPHSLIIPKQTHHNSWLTSVNSLDNPSKKLLHRHPYPFILRFAFKVKACTHFGVVQSQISKQSNKPKKNHNYLFCEEIKSWIYPTWKIFSSYNHWKKEHILDLSYWRDCFSIFACLSPFTRNLSHFLDLQTIIPSDFLPPRRTIIEK